MERLPLDGAWTFGRPGAEPERTVQVPGCWEAAGVPVMESGPFVLRREAHVPPTWLGRRVRLAFGAVSYHLRASIDGVVVGEHTGAWDPFAFDVTGAVVAGTSSTIELEITKPAGLLDGPSGPVAPGPFPLRTTLAGFLPYVTGHLFGGPWQGVALESSEHALPDELSASGSGNGSYRMGARFAADDGSAGADGAPPYEVVVRDPEGRVVARHEGRGRRIELEGRLADARTWSTDAPHLYTAELRAAGEPLAMRRFGFRNVSADGAAILLDGAPLYPRLALSWGWYPDVPHANPSRERVREDLLRLRELGFNGVKYCLWVPPPHVLDVADELGMLTWLELPMWLPRADDAFAARAAGEYERIVRAVRHHPSLVLYSLGCELDAGVGAELLERLYRQTKALVGDALVRDNSGSGEAYGGLLDEYAEYYDYHFYAELPAFGPLLEHFTPRSRPVQPLLFGEFCDSDTFRDLRELDAAPGGRPAWATLDDARNPKGARWQYDLPFAEERLRASGLWERGAELKAISLRQALLQRKATLELVRASPQVSGYVVTGERDTPISTAGVLDDSGALKFDPAAFRAFNGDSVLAATFDRRRAWVRGGDRAAPYDPHGYRSGDAVRVKVVLAHHGRAAGAARLRWTVEGDDGGPIAEGDAAIDRDVRSGDVREVAVVRFSAPEVPRPRRLTLRARVDVARETIENDWPLWCFPRRDPGTLPAIALHDPEGLLAGVERALRVVGDGADVTVATEWSREVDRRTAAGGATLLIVRGRTDDPLPSAPMPFWREAVKVLEPHPAWGEFPHDGFTDLQFFGVGPDLALDLAGRDDAGPVMRRVDARTMAVNDYASVLVHGRGLLLATTLRFWGGLGEQAAGIERNVCAQELLLAFVTYLAGRVSGAVPGSGRTARDH